MNELTEYSTEYSTYVIDVLLAYAPRLASAILVVVLGFWIVGIITRSFARMMDRSAIDVSLRPFLRSLLNVILKILLVISVMSMIGIEMTSFVAILGAAGLAVGMALSGTLQNFAGGVMILMFKPYKVGDWIEAQGYSGTVSEIRIFSTILKTPDNKTIIIPNGGLATGSMINYTTEARRRVDWTFGIAYGDDVDKAREVLKKLIASDERILADPEPFIAVSALADSSVNLVVRVWVNAENYWGVFFDMNENVYKTFGNEGLHIPFPQLDVHVQK